ncbi:MAG: HAD hydrolase-like protein [Rhodospirillales bacterium]|nr:HAD hydrolase-like protein [Rhodospirillales bacterium]
MPRALLIDLDGTLTDLKPGITNCIRSAIEQSGRTAPPADDLEWCIGPPLLESFKLLLPGAGDQAALDALAHYRVRFGEKGLYENTLYPGIPEFLGAMKDAGRDLFVATSKPHVYAGPILEHFELDGYFTGIYGSEMDGTRADKRQLLAHLLAQEELDGADTIMIGDRRHDVEAARSAGAGAVWADWGYGDEAEREEVQPDHICRSAAELSALLADMA